MAIKVIWQDEAPAYRRIGTRTKMNADFPVENKVLRTGLHRWTVFFLLCNGSWDRSQHYSSRMAAYDAAGITD